MVWFGEPARFRAERLAGLVTSLTGGELHAVLAPQAVWLDDAERAAARREVAGLVRQHGGKPFEGDEPELAEVATLLSRPPEARFGWLGDTVTGARLGVLVAASRWFRLIAVRDGDDVFVRTFRATRLSWTLADVLPGGTRKPVGEPVTVLRTEPADDPRVRRFATLPPSIVAELYVEARPPGGQHRLGEPLRVYDTADGRWLVTTTADELTLAPADKHDVARALETARHALG
ncbi:ESX secretion-associated protein EspG [Amycolatopsis sp. NBC_00345]|uniref:ESX secretion-associated protein EspG n=1 Tax=Amycolatopsis sp. NBC_00345 TaxID=2975955 RepID=UPI002E2611D3